MEIQWVLQAAVAVPGTALVRTAYVSLVQDSGDCH